MNPLIKNTRILIIYILFWMLVCIGHFILMYAGYNFSVFESIADSLVFNMLFAIIGIGLWYPIYYNNSNDKNFTQAVLQQLAYGILTIGIWVSVGSYVVNAWFTEEKDIVGFIFKTIPWRIAVGILMYGLIVLFYYVLIYYQSFRDKQARETELQALIKESELKTLKSQINPHFLFNSLNSISSLTMVSPEKAQEMVIKLSEFMRYSLSKKNEQLVTLDKEMENINKYLDIEKIRFGKRLNVYRQLSEDCSTGKLPALILQPIVENCIKYGVYEATEQSDIQINCETDKNYLKISLSNTYEPDFVSNKGEGIGLINISKRMQIIYSRSDLVKISKTNRIFTVELYFPQNNVKIK